MLMKSSLSRKMKMNLWRLNYTLCVVLKLLLKSSRVLKKKMMIKADLRKAVEDSGFGGLIDAFSHQSFIFRASLTKEFVLSKDDVYDMFCLPRGPHQVPLIETGNRFTSTKDPLKVKWREIFHVQGNSKAVPLAKIADKLKAKEHGDDEFKRLFVMLAMSSFLAPTSNYQTDFRLLYALEDVSKIGQFDWSEYVFNKLISGFYKHKVQGKAFCGGCLLFFMLEYFHRIEFRGEVLNWELPLIQHWTDIDLSVKVKQVFSSGGLGNGLMSKTQFPICKNSDGGATSMPVGESRAPAQSKPLVVNISRSASRSSSRLLTFELPEGMEKDEEIHQRAAGDEIQELFLQLKRNTDVIRLFHMRHLNGITERFVAAFGDSRISPTQRFSKDPDYYVYINSLIAKMREVKEVTDFLAVFGISSQMPSRTSEGEFVINADVEAGAPSHLNDGSYDGCARFGGLESVVLKASNVRGNNFVEEVSGSEFARDAVSFVPLRPQLATKLLSHECCCVNFKVSRHDGLGCSIDCGLVDRDELVVSNFLIEHRDVLSSMLTLRKQVADFCFLNDYDRSDGEPLVSYGMCHIIPGEGILTFRPDKMVTTTIIEYWSLLLNELEYREKHQPSRVFFGVSHMLPLESIMENKNLGNAIEELYDCWDMWNHLNAHNLNLNADMIFIPLLAEQHFFCVCVNFKSRRLEYLDNRKYDCWMERDPTMMCKTVCEHMSAYLKGKSIVRAAEISSFDIVNVEF